ncbi:SIS domain-containing protein [Alteromonas pelagimontana]|uniref:SIS domain-containing protein n=1 Tax=Alteromonas pelagimontana TaxID=1858656 RepID=A0A6M4MCS4_9ALTE|nr:SIS domain-containing protein [Alteromonas pelagimontana]QJR80450.1 SIS domain-containing protein [Alteromonas pelagimontana]
MSNSIMAQEAGSSPAVIANQRAENQQICRTLGDKFRQSPPAGVMMIGRGTSDHAGVYAKYLFEIGCNVPVFAAAPSVAGVYNATLNLHNFVAIVISQSGKSPDILHQVKLAKAGGAFCIALVNDTHSPLVALVDAVIPLHAGEEKAVAATKSYLSSLSAICQLYAYWKQDDDLKAALLTLPKLMTTAVEASPLLTADKLAGVAHCVVLGRGFGYAIAREIALKLKEVLGIHAEAFSSAEFLHGPVTLVENKLCVLNVSINDESAQVHNKQVEDVIQRGARVVNINLLSSSHPRIQALAIMQRFYLDIEQVAQARGVDPDTPPGLKKVTETV